jgi:hypothetical protein
VQREIRGNHIALVEEGRSGEEVAVSDKAIAWDTAQDIPRADKIENGVSIYEKLRNNETLMVALEKLTNIVNKNLMAMELKRKAQDGDGADKEDKNGDWHSGKTGLYKKNPGSGQVNNNKQANNSVATNINGQRQPNINNTSKGQTRSIIRSMTFKAIKEDASPEVRAKMESVHIDFDKDNVLPELNENEIKILGIKPLKVRLKKNIIDRQEFRHPEIKDEDVNMLLATGLYAPDFVDKGRGDTGNGYMNFIKKLGNNDNSLVLLDLKESIDEKTGKSF